MEPEPASNGGAVMLGLLGFTVSLVAIGLRAFPLLSAILMCGGAFLLNVGFTMYSARKQKKYIVYQAFCVFYIIQPFALLSLLILFPVDTATMLESTTILNGNAHTLLYSFCLVPFIGSVFTFFHTSPQSGQPPVHRFIYILRKDSYVLGEPLIIAAFLNFSVWFIDLLPLYLAYGMRVLREAFQYCAFLAGCVFSLKSYSTVVWSVTLLLGLVFAGVTGHRGYGFVPVLFFGLGILLFSTWRIRLLVLLGMVVIIPLGVKYIGLIDTVRNTIGRTELQNRSIEELTDTYNNAVQEMESTGNYDDGKGNEKFKGLRRTVDWALVVVPNLSPQNVPFRGYSDYGEELAAMFYFGGVNLVSTWVRPYNSVLYARNYGFTVYIGVEDNRLKSSTVPFNLVSDSWSRYGLISSFFQISAFIWILILFERLTLRLFRYDIIGYIFIMTSLIGQAFYYCNVYSLVKNTRRLLLYTVMLIILAKVYASARKVFSNRYGQKRSW